MVECRGPRLDRELRTAWDLLRINGTRYVRPDTVRRRVVSFDLRRKSEALPGLELADLVVSPMDAGWQVCQAAPAPRSS